jgi:hypothetical protein
MEKPAMPSGERVNAAYAVTPCWPPGLSRRIDQNGGEANYHFKATGRWKNGRAFLREKE